MGMYFWEFLVVRFGGGEMYVLGIDGGGTKTVAVIADSYGNIHSFARVGSTNSNGVDKDQVIRELQNLFEQLKGKNEKVFNQLLFAFGGFSGIENPAGRKLIESVFQEYLVGVPFRLVNDAVSALYSGTLGKPGIVQIAGTGSITYGLNDKGEALRVGGWGYLIDDEGSGYYMGKNALSAIFQSYDGRLTETKLTYMIMDYFKVNDIPELIPLIYSGGEARKKIAPLSKFVTEAALQNDQIALNILESAGRKLGQAIYVMIKRLYANGEFPSKIPVVLTGGVFSSRELFVPFIQEELKDFRDYVSLIKPIIPPIGGSVAAAWISTGHLIDSDFADQFAQSIKSFD